MMHDPSPINVAPRRRSPLTSRLVFGLLLIFLGVVFTLDQMRWIDAEDVLRLWPLVLIAAGAGKLFGPRSAGSRFTGLILIVVGGWLLLEILDVVYASIWDYWPLLLVLVGVRIVWRGLVGESRAAADSASTVNAVAMLGGMSRASDSPDFRGGDMMAFMGGCEVDLRRARIATGPAVIDAFAFWGGVEIRVPEDWVVSVKGIPFMGGYEDNTRPLANGHSDPSSRSDGPPPLPPGEPPPLPSGFPYAPRQELVVKGFAIMGGVEVKN